MISRRYRRRWARRCERRPRTVGWAKARTLRAVPTCGRAANTDRGVSVFGPPYRCGIARAVVLETLLEFHRSTIPMARIRHIALVVKDLEKTATFYQKAFGLSRSEMSEG